MLGKLIVAVLAVILVLIESPIYVKLCDLSKKDLNKQLAYGAVCYIVLRYVVGNPIINGISLINSTIANLLAVIMAEVLICFIGYFIATKKNWDKKLFGLGFALCALLIKITIPLLTNVVYLYQIYKNGIEYYGSSQQVLALINISPLVYLAKVFAGFLVLECLSNCFNEKNFWGLVISCAVITNLTGLLNGAAVIVLVIGLTVYLLRNKIVILRGINE